MSNVGRFGSTTGSEYGHGSNVQLAGGAFGAPVSQTGTLNAPAKGVSSVQRAGLFSTAPYVPPKKNKTLQCQGKPGCKGWVVKSLFEQTGRSLCIGHARAAGLIEPANQHTKAKEEAAE